MYNIGYMAGKEVGFIDRTFKEPTEKALNVAKKVALVAGIFLGVFGKTQPALTLFAVSALAYFGEQALKPQPQRA